MRHQNKIAKLGRTHSHRKATMAALSTALIKHKRITTTLAKAKALRSYVEPLITRCKVDNTLNRRQVFRYLQDKHAVTELFTEISGKLGDRPGGYTRVVKLGQRAGDSAQMAVIELVDYNESGGSKKDSGRSKRTRRGRAGSGRKAAAATTSVETAEEAVEAAEDAAVATDEIQEAAEADVQEVAEAEEVAGSDEDSADSDSVEDQGEDKKD